MAADPRQICFGLSLEQDQQSVALFLQLCGDRRFSEVLASRLSAEEIADLTDQIMFLLRRHLSEKEYHQLFLRDRPPPP